MRKAKNKEPIYDERVKATLKGLAEGKTRAELAKSFGLSSWKSLDVSLKRKNFTWSSENNTYIPANNKMDDILDKVESNIPIKAERIIKKFDDYGEESDPKMIAEDMGFENHKDMAEYMEENNLVWIMAKGNYIESIKNDIDEIDDSESLEEVRQSQDSNDESELIIESESDPYQCQSLKLLTYDD